MSFLSPIAALIAAAITIPALVLLYFLKLRRRTVDVSSTLLWRRAIEDLQVNAPFQKLRRNLLLFLQLLILAALLFAFARPTAMGLAGTGQRIVIIIDHSASMNATDVSPTRLGRAKRIARDLVEGVAGQEDLQTGAGAMVIAFARGAHVMQPFTTDQALLRRAIDAIEPTDQDSKLKEALRLVEPYAVGPDGDAAERELLVFVLSDGRLSDPRNLTLAGAELRYVPIAAPPEVAPTPEVAASQPTDSAEDTDANANLAIISFAARRDYDNPRRVEVVSRLANFSRQSARANVSLTVDGRVESVKALDLGPYTTSAADGEPQPGQGLVTWQLDLPGTALVTVAHNRNDILPADNQAALVIAPPKRWRILLVTAGNVFLDRALRGAQGVGQVVTLTPGQYDLRNPTSLRAGEADGGFDVIVFDRYTPQEIPPAPALYFAGAPPLENLRLIGTDPSDSSVRGFWSWQRDHPLLRHVVLDGVVFESAGRWSLPDRAQVVATGSAGPVLATVRDDHHTHVLVAINLVRSNWPLELTFPVFIDNAIGFLAPGAGGEAGLSFTPGDVAVIPAQSSDSSLTYEGPATITANANAAQAVVGPFRRAGVYETTQPIRQPWDRLAVNLLDITESDPRPAQTLPIAVDPGRTTQTVSQLEREIWPRFIWAALVILMLEWLIYTRRMHL